MKKMKAWPTVPELMRNVTTPEAVRLIKIDHSGREFVKEICTWVVLGMPECYESVEKSLADWYAGILPWTPPEFIASVKWILQNERGAFEAFQREFGFDWKADLEKALVEWEE